GSMISVLLLVRTKPPPPLSTLFPYTTLFRSTASDVIYQELALFKRETGRPVVAVMLDVAASGGYYVALAADTIVAHPTTVTGSIGVLMVTLSAEGLLDRKSTRLNSSHVSISYAVFCL